MFSNVHNNLFTYNCMPSLGRVQNIGKTSKKTCTITNNMNNKTWSKFPLILRRYKNNQLKFHHQDVLITPTVVVQ